MSITFKVRKKDALRRKLLALAPATEGEIRKAVRRSVDELAAKARDFAPERTGALKRSIEAVTFDEGLRGAVQARAPHAHLVEFGTVRAKARPFLFPSYRLLRKRIKGRFSRAINKAAKQVAKR